MMKFVVPILATLAVSASAFGVAPKTHRSPAFGVAPSVYRRHRSTALAAGNILSELSQLEGPSICWGPEGIMQGKKELEIKEYDGFVMFKAALEQAGLANQLRGKGPFTLLAPTDGAVLRYQGVLDEDVLKYHIIMGDIYSDEFEGELETMNGEKLKCRFEYRRSYADDGEYFSLVCYSIKHLLSRGILFCLVSFVDNVVLSLFSSYWSARQSHWRNTVPEGCYL